MMREQSGSQFDPMVFDVLEDIARETQQDVHAEGDPAVAEVERTTTGLCRRRSAPRRRIVRKPVKTKISERQLVAAGDAEHGFDGGRGRSVIEEVPGEALSAVRRFAARKRRTLCGRARPSVAVAQYGYAEVPDGFELKHGATRWSCTRTIQLVADAATTSTPSLRPGRSPRRSRFPSRPRAASRC